MLDDQLVKQGLRIYKCKSKRELVHLALNELVNKAKRRTLLELRGKVKWKGDLGEMRRSRWRAG